MEAQCELKAAGKPYPRTCPVCKLGPCQRMKTVRTGILSLPEVKETFGDEIPIEVAVVLFESPAHWTVEDVRWVIGLMAEFMRRTPTPAGAEPASRRGG